jgi:phage-related tail fiber protein
MATIDRRGVSADATDTAVAGDPNPGLAIKAPVLAATTGNVTLSGLQTVDSVALAEGNRVLVWKQTDATQNGLYNASSGPWTRTVDANSNDKVVAGLQVAVTGGTANRRTVFYFDTPDPILLGTTPITIVAL